MSDDEFCSVKMTISPGTDDSGHFGLDQDGSSPPMSPLACYTCKDRKVGCDKILPVCVRCSKAGVDCEYPSRRRRPALPYRKPQVRKLKAEIQKLKERLESHSASRDTTSPLAELVTTGRFDHLPPRTVIEELTELYFEKISTDASMIHAGRYLTSLPKPIHMQPPVCLQYAVLAAGASVSSELRYLSEAFYGRARQYLQADEMNGEGHHVTLGHVQAWILVSHFEAQHLWFSRASMSIARAIRLGHVLGLHRLDGPNTAGLTLQPALDSIEEEERRKTFWVMFCTDRITSSTGGWPVMMDARSIQTRLLRSHEHFSDRGQESFVSLKQALKHGMSGLSPSACKVVSVHLFHDCFHFARSSDVDHDDDLYAELQQLEYSISNAFGTMPVQLRCPESIHDLNAVFINLQLHTALICIYQAVTTVSPEGIAKFPYILPKVYVSAMQIVMIVDMVADVKMVFRNPLISFATYIAASFFLQDFLLSGNPRSDKNLRALMDLMIDVGKTNVFTASLAMRLAQSLHTSGIDKTSLERVRSSMIKLKIDGPLPQQDDERNGIVILCPAMAHIDFR